MKGDLAKPAARNHGRLKLFLWIITQNFLLCMLLQTGIQMDVDDHHGEKEIAFSGMDAHIMKKVIVKHLVVCSFAGSEGIVNFPIFICSSGRRG